jgi:hypothetical protein
LQIKNTIRVHLTLIKMGIFKGINKTVHAGKYVGKQEPLYTLVGIQISTTIMESSVKIPQKAKDRTAL